MSGHQFQSGLFAHSTGKPDMDRFETLLTEVERAIGDAARVLGVAGSGDKQRQSIVTGLGEAARGTDGVHKGLDALVAGYRPDAGADADAEPKPNGPSVFS